MYVCLLLYASFRFMTINTAQEGKQTATSSACLRFMDRLAELPSCQVAKLPSCKGLSVMFVQIWRNKAQCMQPRKYFLVIADAAIGVLATHSTVKLFVYMVL